ncbi:MAG: guanylate kinase [Myxococcales bacterium]|nr:guanylate kinase [Myxococcales bacterium]
MTVAGPATANGLLLVLVGPAGAGKTTVARGVIARAPDLRAFSVSYTTRPQRPAERDGVDYWFVPRPDFEALGAADGFVEWAEVHGNLYGTSRGEVERLRTAGRIGVFDVDIQGAHNLWRAYPDCTRLCFLLPPSWAVLVERLAARGTDAPAVVERRLRTARAELAAVVASPAPWYVVRNAELAAAVDAVEQLVVAAAPAPDDVANDPAVHAFLRDASADARAA